MRWFAFLLILFSLNIGCNDDDETFDSTGVITGFDATLCACCGGWIIEIDIDGDPKNYRINSIPDTFVIEEDDLPIEVKFNYSIESICTTTVFINIDEIQLN